MQAVIKQKMRTLASPMLFGLALLLLWEAICQALSVPRFVLPKPTAIAYMLGHRWSVIWPNMLQTLATTLSGFSIGVTIGFILGVCLGGSTRLYKTIFPALIGVNSVPKAALVPLIILWAGLGSTPAVVTSAVIVIFPIAVVVATSIATMDSELKDVLRSLGASRFDTIVKIGIPQSMPYFLGSLKIAISLSFVGTIVAESVAANRGLGYMMNRAASDFDFELVFAGVGVLAALGIFFYAISVFCERRLAAWAYRRRD